MRREFRLGPDPIFANCAMWSAIMIIGIWAIIGLAIWWWLE